MKHYTLLLLLLFRDLAPVAQPTGQSGIYFAIYEVVKGDTLAVTRALADSAFDQQPAFRVGNYRISDGGVKQYGFDKLTWQSFVRKVYFWHEENILTITRNRNEVMTIHFVNLPVNYYFLNIHFQKGSYAFVFPDSKPVGGMENHLPQKRVGNHLYGYDISPANWAAHRLQRGEKPAAAHSVLPARKPPIPYAAEWTGACTRITRVSNGRPPTVYAVYCWTNNGKVIFVRRDEAANGMIWWEGDITTDANGSYTFQFYSGYFWGTDKSGDAFFSAKKNGCNVIASQHTAAMLTAMQVSGQGMYPKEYPLHNAGCDDECFLYTDSIARPGAATVKLLYTQNGSAAVTQDVDLPIDGRALRFETIQWNQQEEQPVMRFRLRNKKLVLEDDEKNPFKDELTLNLVTH